MKKMVYLFIASILTISCADDAISPSDINGEWVLTSFVCYCLPENRDITPGEHTWVFDSEEQKVIVENNSSNSNQNTLLTTGSYPISIADSSVTIADQSYDFYFKDDQLILSDQPELDGPILTFIKKSAFVPESDTCSMKAIQSESIYNDGPAAQHTIESVDLTNNCLHITYASSGCSGESGEIQLVDQGVIMESFPVQKNIRLSLMNEEECQAVFQKDIWVDISPLQVNGESKINFNLEGWGEQILYEY